MSRRQANRWNVQRLRKFQQNAHSTIDDQSNDHGVVNNNNTNDDDYDDYTLPGAYAVSRWYDHQRIRPATNLAILEQQWDEEDQEEGSHDLNATVVLPRRDPLSRRNVEETEEEKENTYATYGQDNVDNDIPNQYLERYYIDQHSSRDPNANKTNTPQQRFGIRKVSFIASIVIVVAILCTTILLLLVGTNKNTNDNKSICTIHPLEMMDRWCKSGFLEVPFCANETFQRLAIHLSLQGIHNIVIRNNNSNSNSSSNSSSNRYTSNSKYPCDDIHLGLLATSIAFVESKGTNGNDDIVMDDEMLILPYWTLATIYFAMGGPNWRNNNNWLDSNIFDENQSFFCPTNNVEKRENSIIEDSGWYGISCSQEDPNSIIAIEFMSNDNVIGTIPTAIALLTSLQILNLNGGGSVSGTIPSEIGTMWNLSQLFLGGTNLNGTIPSEIGQCQGLQVLNLFGVTMTGTIPTEIGQLSQLANFALWSPVQGRLPTEMGLLTSLTKIQLAAMNTVQGGIPWQFQNLSNLTAFYIDGDFRDRIQFPSFLSSLPKSLITLYITSAQFHGSIPTDISLFTHMTHLRLMDVVLTGTLPSEIGLMRDLRFLEFQGSKVVGNIPSEIGRLTHLEVLNLQCTQLSKSLPTEIQQLSTLTITLPGLC